MPIIFEENAPIVAGFLVLRPRSGRSPDEGVGGIKIFEKILF